MQTDALEQQQQQPLTDTEDNYSSSATSINNKNKEHSDNNDVDLKSESSTRYSNSRKDCSNSTSTVSVLKKKHVCNVCSKNFLGLSDLRRHLRIHSGERPYECEYCKKTFRQSVSLRNHIACIHEKKQNFSCEYCAKTFPIKERLRLHLRKHTGEKPYSCTFCNKSFARGGQLKQHLPSHSGEKKHCCKQCNASFTSKLDLFNHRKKIHYKKFSQPTAEDSSKICRICSKRFTTVEGLKRHGLICHKHIKQFYCTICNKTLKGHLQQHLNVHDNIKLYNCSKCGTKFAQKSQLNVHERVHTGERPFLCKVCGQSFSHSYVLKTHYRKHTGEKPFKCPICINDIAFAQLPHLKTHMRCIHGKDKTYMCDGCEEFFKMKNELQQHMSKCSKRKLRKHSADETINNSSDKFTSDNQAQLTDIRLNVVIILKKISSKDRLHKLGVEKRLIDNVIQTALKQAGKKYHDDPNLNEIDRLKMNIEEFLEWTLPKSIMEKFKEEKKSIEEIIEQLAMGYCKNEKNEKQ